MLQILSRVLKIIMAAGESFSPPLIPTNIEKYDISEPSTAKRKLWHFWRAILYLKKYLLAFNDTHNSVVNHIQRIL